jgi:two-component system cell cycle response regulator
MPLITRRRFPARRGSKSDIRPPAASATPVAVGFRAAGEPSDRELENRNAQLWGLAAAAGSARELLAAVEHRDGHSATRANAVVALAVGVGRRLGLDNARLADLEWAARLHDIGKVCISRSILDKPGQLTRDEWADMRRHAEIGERIIASVSELTHLASTVRAGHERWDGTGYPDRLRGEEIPLASRIVFVCDAYHAMMSDAPYRHVPLTAAEARAELECNAGTQFCPTVAAAALAELTDLPIDST